MEDAYIGLAGVLNDLPRRYIHRKLWETLPKHTHTSSGTSIARAANYRLQSLTSTFDPSRRLHALKRGAAICNLLQSMSDFMTTRGSSCVQATIGSTMSPTQLDRLKEICAMLADTISCTPDDINSKVSRLYDLCEMQDMTRRVQGPLSQKFPSSACNDVYCGQSGYDPNVRFDANVRSGAAFGPPA